MLFEIQIVANNDLIISKDTKNYGERFNKERDWLNTVTQYHSTPLKSDNTMYETKLLFIASLMSI